MKDKNKDENCVKYHPHNIVYFHFIKFCCKALKILYTNDGTYWFRIETACGYTCQTSDTSFVCRNGIFGGLDRGFLWFEVLKIILCVMSIFHALLKSCIGGNVLMHKRNVAYHVTRLLFPDVIKIRFEKSWFARFWVFI